MGSSQEHPLLRHHGDLAAQTGKGAVSDRQAIDGDGAAVGIVETIGVFSTFT
jgi:hypothetical protein